MNMYVLKSVKKSTKVIIEMFSQSKLYELSPLSIINKYILSTSAMLHIRFLCDSLNASKFHCFKSFKSFNVSMFQVSKFQEGSIFQYS